MLRKVLPVLLLAAALTGCAAQSSTFDVEMKEFAFDPDHFTVQAGAPVTLNLKNTGHLEHDFVIMVLSQDAQPPFDAVDQANVYWESRLAPQEEATLQFAAPSGPGEYHIVCSIPGHLEQNMRATLTVEP